MSCNNRISGTRSCTRAGDEACDAKHLLQKLLEKEEMLEETIDAYWYQRRIMKRLTQKEQEELARPNADRARVETQANSSSAGACPGRGEDNKGKSRNRTLSRSKFRPHVGKAGPVTTIMKNRTTTTALVLRSPSRPPPPHRRIGGAAAIATVLGTRKT